MEVGRSYKGIYLLREINMLDCKLADTPVGRTSKIQMEKEATLKVDIRDKWETDLPVPH